MCSEIDENYMRHLLSFTPNSAVSLEVNSRYLCEAAFPISGLLFVQDAAGQNSPCRARTSHSMEVTIWDKEGYHDVDKGRLSIHYDSDLGSKWSMSLAFYSKHPNEKAICKSISVATCIEVPRKVSHKMINELLQFAPLAPLKDPDDHRGLTGCTFESKDGKMPSLEYWSDGQLYFEIVDFSDYSEGEITHSDWRENVICCKKLTHLNVHETISKINARLKQFYSVEKEMKK